MLEKEKIERINTLARKAKKEELSLSEQEEQQSLRREYLASLREGMKNHLEAAKILDPEGNDVTPEKIKKIQKEKGMHDR